ncbi:MAG: hypothetical protein IJ752_07610 [Alphaproteobacteria bacterium]|nr:hypothetical protein [Alphaproteobacteria bacterium]
MLAIKTGQMLDPLDRFLLFSRSACPESLLEHNGRPFYTTAAPKCPEPDRHLLRSP